jgi:hypothetical protein
MSTKKRSFTSLGQTGPDKTFVTRTLKEVPIKPGQWNFVLFGRNSDTAMVRTVYDRKPAEVHVLTNRENREKMGGKSE